jgi:DNA primase
VSDFAQTVKQQADIVKVIEAYIRLRKAGATNYSGLCPFHKEKSPSFSVHAVRQFYHCFGCGVSGDVFSFVGKIENVSFPEAVRMVAQKCGIPLPKKEYSSPEEAAEARLRRKLLDLHEAAAAWFEEQLRGPEGAVAREYLAGRGLTPEGIKAFRIGYAPDSFNALRERLSSMADVDTLRASGLFSAKEQGDGTMGPLYDRFRKRVMFPIASESGRVIAFTARTLETGEKAGPKYINSPETPLYTKGQVLFNLDKARSVIRQAGFALLVEGQMDCISVFLRGIQNVIATSGTAFTEQQVAILRRHTSNVVVNFDGDTAGENAVEKFADKIAPLIEEGLSIRVVSLDSGLDPDRFIRERGVEAYVEAVKGARGLDYFLIERARHLFPGAGPEQKVKQVNFLLPHILRIPEMLARNQFRANAEQKLGIDSAVLNEKFRQAALKRRDHIEVAVSTITDTERVLVRALANREADGVEQRNLISEALTQHFEWFQHLTLASSLLEMAGSRDPMTALTDGAQRSTIAGILIDADKVPSDDKSVGIGFLSGKNPTIERIDDTLAGLHIAWLEKQFLEVESNMSEARSRGDLEQEIDLAQKRLVLKREMQQLHNHRPPAA